MLSNYEFEKYVCTKETLQDTIQKFGVAIVPNVLDSDECEKMVNGIWDFLEHITHEWEKPLNRDDKTSWNEFFRLYPSHSMLLQHWNVGHIQASWDVRQNVKICEIFAYFWNCRIEDLLVSFDGLSFHLPPEITNKGWNRNHTWFHTDQSYMTPDFKCIQSFVTGMDVHSGDSTLTIMEGSHIYHREFKEKYDVTCKDDWYKLNDEQRQFYVDEKGCKVRNIRCPKGSLVVWDSRTIHCSINATKGREIANLRAVIYLCYMRRDECSEKDLKKKVKALSELRTTTHYPCHIKLFPKNPRTYGGILPTIKENGHPVLTDIGKSIAGL